MRWTSALAIYILFWSFCVFLVLPFGVRTSDEAGVERVPGQSDSAPHTFAAGKIALRVTIVATLLWGLYMLNYSYGWVRAKDVDLSGQLANVE